MSDAKPHVVVHEDGPYVIESVESITTSQGNSIPLSPLPQLCRCGLSRRKPFCDRSHVAGGFRSHKLHGRQPDRIDRHVGKGITILDNRGVCSHRGHCTDNLPSVFKIGTEPWIDPDAAPVEEIVRVIRMCPSGALAYELHDEEVTEWQQGPGINLVKNGPIEVSEIVLDDENGNQPQTRDHYTLCRCGGSRNKPFCDGTHWHNGFQDAPTATDVAGSAVYDRHMAHIQMMADGGRSVIEPMGPAQRLPSWDDITVRGAQLHRLPVNEDEPVSVETVIGPDASRPLRISLPVYVTHMSFGALSREAKLALAKGSALAKTAMCSGEGGVIPESQETAYRYIFEYVQNEYSFTDEVLAASHASEIKIGQAVKPGIGGHFPFAKITDEIAEIRNRPRDRDIVTPARYSDIVDAGSLRKKVDQLRRMSNGAPVGVKIAAGRIEADLAVALEAGPDFITIDGRGGATGSVPKLIKDSSSVPTLFALARAARYFRDNAVTGVSLVITGGLRVSSDIAKAIALGADAVALGTAALIAIGCRQYRICHTGRCPTGVTSHDPRLRSRIHVETSAERLGRFFETTRRELETFARMCGVSDIHDLGPEDLATHDATISEVTGIALA